jgi:hypothetical protein
MLTLLLMTGCLYDRAQYDAYLAEFADDDKDGYPGYNDCDDENTEVHPGVDEVCDGKDNDCDGTTDLEAIDTSRWYQDKDGDGYGNTEITREGCISPNGFADNGDDCNDDDATIHPEAEESCTTPTDMNCDGQPGNLDGDQDGVPGCDDCNDFDPAIAPDRPEICDGKDNDCSGSSDDNATDATTWYVDADGDGFGDPAQITVSCERPSDATDAAGDCDDNDRAVNPEEEEVCGDGADNDCDGTPNACRPEDNLASGTSLETDGAGQTGAVVVPFGDTNADGISEFLVNSVTYDGGGRIWMVASGVTGDMTLETDADTEIRAASGYLSASERPVDVDGDLVPDFSMVGGEDDPDRIGVLSFASVTERGIRSVADVAHTQVRGIAPYDSVGNAFDVGDLTGDGTPDILIGSESHVDGDYYFVGAAYVIPGPLNGDHTVAEATTIFSGPQGQDQGVGRQTLLRDLNGDGILDATIGYLDPAQDLSKVGALSVFYGPISGDYEITDADLCLVGTDDNETLGATISSNGDDDGDGLDDFWIGSSSPYSADGLNRTGYAFYLRSPITGGVVRDLAYATLNGEAAADYFGDSLSLGDLDQDGATDLWTGSTGQSQAGEGSGKAYLFYGPFAGTRSAVDADAFHLGSGTNVGGANGLAILGDVNGDGEVDLAFGEATYNNKGRSVVIFGYSY